MAELTERELRDKRRNLESLNARDLRDKQLQIQQMAIFKNDDRPTSVSRYNAAKKRLDELSNNIEARKVEIESIQTQISNIQNNKVAEKRTKDIASKQKELKFAQETRNTSKIETLTKEIETLQNQQSASNKDVAEDKEYPGDNDFVKDVNAKGLALTTDDENGGSWVSGAEEGKDQVPQYIYIGEESRPVETVGGKLRRGGLSVPYTPSTPDFDALRKMIIQDAIKSPRGLKGLFDDLRGAGLRIPRVDYDRLDTTSTSFGKALSYALQKHTKVMINDLEQNKNINPKSFFKFMQEDLKNSDGGPEVSYEEYATKVDEAESDLNRFFMEYVGRSATDEEQRKYYKQLRALEKKNARVTTISDTDSGNTSKRVTGEYTLDAEDILELQRKIAGKALDGSDIDVILKGGSRAARDVNNVLAYAKRYGINISNKDALNYVANELSAGRQNMEKVNAKILAISKATYSNLSDVISEDVSLAALSSNYKYNMAKVLELNPDAIDVMDPTIQTALKNNGNKGIMNLTDFDKMLRNDPRWGNTSNALETAAKYANSILRNFGLIA
jgi:predicted DNA-binding protein